MRRIILVAVMAISFISLFPLSWHIAEVSFFTIPFDRALLNPVLLVCSDHVEISRWEEVVQAQTPSPKDGCTFQVTPERQAWVELAARQLQSPNPKKSGWVLRLKQLGDGRQRVDLMLMGDGIDGMIYEVQGGRITPLNSRITGAGGAFIVLGIDVMLWVVVWLVIWAVSKLRLNFVRIHN